MDDSAIGESVSKILIKYLHTARRSETSNARVNKNLKRAGLALIYSRIHNKRVQAAATRSAVAVIQASRDAGKASPKSDY